ncbi:MAG: dihydroneopterin aldolase [Alphaproteobacteria bacterium]
MIARSVPARDSLEAGLLAAHGGFRRIFFRDLALDVAIGAHEFERGRTQPVLVSIDLYLVPGPPPASDRLDAVFDYDRVRSGVMALLADGHIELQETLVERIAAMCLAFADVVAVRVSSQKTTVYPDVAGVGYEVVRVGG